MMKILLGMMFVMPLIFTKKSFWMLQSLFFLFSFIFFFNFSFDFNFYNLSYFWGMDLFSFVLILLSFWICGLMFLASEGVYKHNYYKNMFSLTIILLMISLYCTFSALNLLIFYIFFEMSLIPTLILIVGWEYQPERIQAGIYLLFYTLMASLPMMLTVFFYYLKFGTLDYFFFFYLLNESLFYICMILVFLVKMPMYFLHLWLPKAHVEAPVMIGGMYVSLICLRQSDMKSLIAYSSVAHMGIVLSGIMTVNFWGMGGVLVMMVAHGLCSSGLFCLANISYERLFSEEFVADIMYGTTYATAH